MKKYVDGFVLPVLKKNLDAYRKMADEAGKTWVDHGALEYYECVGEDLAPDMGDMKSLTFPDLVNIKTDEIVVFSFIVYKSRKHRDEVNKKVMDYFKEKYKDKKEEEMPFDIERMAYGGFESIVEYKLKS